MAGGIWSALGAALSQGANTFGNLTADEDQRREQAVRLKLAHDAAAREEERQSQALRLQQEGADRGVQDRRIAQLQQAISGAQPGDDLTSFAADIRSSAPHLMTQLGKGGPGVAQGLPTVMGGNADAPSETFSRRGTPEELAAQAAFQQAQGYRDWVNANPTASPQDRFLGAQRFGQKFTGLSPTEELAKERELAKIAGDQQVRVANVRASASQASQNASALEMAADQIMADPQKYHKLPKPTQAKLAPVLSAKGFQFPDAPPPPPSPYNQERAFRVGQSVDELSGNVGQTTTGFLGSFLRKIPGTGAKDFAAELNTLKSNIMVNELVEMRAASKTGGALGQVSDKEGALLADSLGALDQDQSPANVAKQLMKIKATLERWDAAKATLQNNGTVRVSPRNPQADAPVDNPAGGPKVGERKQFPNGNVGVWDGKGWVAQ